MQNKWYEIELAVPCEHAEAAAAMLVTRAGFAGCEQRERGGLCHVVVFVQGESRDAAEASAAEAAAVLRQSPSLRETSPHGAVRELDPEVWTQNWRRHFARHTIGGRIEIVPPWEEASPPSAGVISIVINPGMAFGTGLHETTSGCLEALIAHVRAGDRVLDLGCGSAILAIAAARLGASEALALDNDPVAVEAAQENIDANAVAPIVHAAIADDAGDVIASEANERPFDVVVANILAETLVAMQDRLTRAVRDGGVLILSGIEASRLAMVQESFVQPGWQQIDLLERGEWATLVLHRAPLAP